MAGEDLEKHVDVKHILVEMGTYFQVQVISFNMLKYFYPSFSVNVDHAGKMWIYRKFLS